MDDYKIRFLNAVESIADSLKMLVEKPPVGITLEMQDGFTEASGQVRDLVLADQEDSD
jgi:hypothetical protein